MQDCRFSSGKHWYSIKTSNEQTPLLSRQNSDDGAQCTNLSLRKTTEENTPSSRLTQEEENSKLPQFIWLMLKITCVFWQKRLIVRRICFHCQMNRNKCLIEDDDAGGRNKGFLSYFDADGQGYEYGEAELEPCPTNRENFQCKMCDSYWWNSKGKVKRYTEQEIGAQRWNGTRSSLLSVVVLVCLLFINVCDISVYIRYQEKDKNSRIHILSYAIYMIELSLYPFMCLYSKLRTSTQEAAPKISWSTSLNARFIIKRMQFVDFRRKRFPGDVLLFMCFAWPFGLVIFRLLIYIYLCKGLKGLSFIRIISILNTFASMLIWSNAQYIMYLCRLSFQRQLQLVANYIKDNQKDLDFCRQLVWHAARDLNCYRRFILVYMSISFPFFTWGATTVLCWQYDQGFKHDDDTCFYIVILVWLQIVMFPLLSVLSLGGLDVSYIWEYFRIKVFTTSRERKSQYFWRKLCHHIEYVGIDAHRVSWTMVFSFISSFMAIYTSDVKSPAST